MSLESCPKCGYALSLADHTCRHCRDSVQPAAREKKLDWQQVLYVGLAMIAVAVLSFGRLAMMPHKVPDPSGQTTGLNAVKGIGPVRP